MSTLNKVGISFFNDLQDNTMFTKAESLREVINFDSAVYFGYHITDDVYELEHNSTKLLDINCFFVSILFEDTYILIKTNTNNEVCKIHMNNIHNIFYCRNSNLLNDLEIYFLFKEYLVTMIFKDVSRNKLHN